MKTSLSIHWDILSVTFWNMLFQTVVTIVSLCTWEAVEWSIGMSKVILLKFEMSPLMILFVAWRSKAHATVRAGIWLFPCVRPSMDPQIPSLIEWLVAIWTSHLLLSLIMIRSHMIYESWISCKGFATARVKACKPIASTHKICFFVTYSSLHLLINDIFIFYLK